jgi:AraC-like DNA-binding protein
MQNYLNLRLERLRAPAVWEQNVDGLFFVFGEGGVGKFTSRTASHKLAEGDVLVFDANVPVKIEVLPTSSEFVFWCFSITTEHLLPLFSPNEVSLLTNIVEAFKSSRLYAATNPLALECHRLMEIVPPTVDLDHRGQLIRICATILSAEFKACRIQVSNRVRSEDGIVHVLEQLSASELINLSVSELADRFNCSRRHLNRLFHKHFQISVSSLKMEMRLLKAISLLRDENIKIIHVAEQCGFNHLGLFNTCFKRRFGTSPGQWRETNLRSAGKAEPKQSKGQSGCPLQNSGLCPVGNQPTQVSVSKALNNFASKIGGHQAPDEDSADSLLDEMPGKTSFQPRPSL